MALVSINKLVELTGKARKTLVRRLSNVKPVEKKGAAYLYDSIIVFDLIYNGAGQNKSDADININQERARLTKAQADAQVLKNQITEKETAPMVILEAALTNVCIQIKSVLESIPLKVKQRVPSLNSMEIEIIAKEIIKAQNAASDIRLDLSIES